jgi:hypothetical protein
VRLPNNQSNNQPTNQPNQPKPRSNPLIEESLVAYFGDNVTEAHLKMADTPVSNAFVE